MILNDYDLIIINSSGGKDSICAIYKMCKMADGQGFPKENIVISHQDLGRMEWNGTKELVERQAEFFGLKAYYAKRRDKNGNEETLLEYVERRGKWPSNKQRFCTSDFKRGPGGRVVTTLTRDKGRIKVLYVFGFRRDESPARAKKLVLKRNKILTTQKRIVDEYLPIHHWDTSLVWKVIKDNNIPYHPAYDLGMPRLSCIFCIFSPFDALVRAGRANPDLLDEYVAVEKKINHSFRKDCSLASVKSAIENGYEPKSVTDWVM